MPERVDAIVCHNRHKQSSDRLPLPRLLDSEQTHRQ